MRKSTQHNTKTVLASALASALALLLAWGCAVQEEQKSLVDSTPETVSLRVSLSGESRAERFLGTFDEIDRLTLDLKRNFDNREVVSGFPLSRDNGTGRWTGTLNNLIVSFEYTVTGHAYRIDNSSDNETALEIFRGETQHTVTSGTNSLALRLTPLLDDRELSVPRITRINRPFQLEKTDNATISVAVTNSDLQPLQYRFRSVDANPSLPISEAEGGSFSPEKGSHAADNSSYPDLVTTYLAPDLVSVQNLQVRVSNDLEIGVTASFKTYVTGPIESETTVNTNPVVESISGERVGDDELKWTVLVSDDDPFDTLVAAWTYQDPESGATRTFDNSTYIEDNSTSRNDVGVGLISTIMHGYQDSDAGMLRVTVCETNYTNHTGSCTHGQDGSTSVDLELVANAYQQPIICEGEACSSPFEGSWIACISGDGQRGDRQTTLTIAGNAATFREQYHNTAQDGSDNGSCSGAVGMTFVYRINFTPGDQVTIDNQSATRMDFSFQSITLSFSDLSLVSNMTQDNSSTLCGYSDWTVDVEQDVPGCSDLGTPPSGQVIKDLISVDNNRLRTGDENSRDNASDGYPTRLGCTVFGPESDGSFPPPACESSHSSSSSSSNPPFSSMVAVSSGSITVGGDNLTGSYASYCVSQNWGEYGPSDMQSFRKAMVVDNGSVSDEMYLYSNDNCSSLIAYEIRVWDNVSVDNGSNGDYSVSALHGDHHLYLNTASGADWLNNIYSGWSSWVEQGDITAGEYRTLGGAGYPVWSRWLIDNASSNQAASDNLSVRISNWRSNASDVDDPSNNLELFRVARDNVSSRYTDNGNGTVTDNQHHLTWQQQDDGVGRDWSDAAAYCSSLSLAGYSDWWLPSKDQLFTLVDTGFSPAIDIAYFLNTQSSNYWSSTSDVSTSYAGSVVFDYGFVSNVPNSYNSYVRCVRTGP